MSQLGKRRYEAKIDGQTVGAFDQPEEALDKVCEEFKKHSGMAIPDVIDNQIPMPFARDSIIQWCIDRSK